MSIKVCTRAEGEFFKFVFCFGTKFQCTIPILAMYVLDVWAQNLAWGKVNCLTVSVTVFNLVLNREQFSISQD